MRKSRRAHSARRSERRPHLEALERRALLTQSASDIAPPSQTFSVLTDDHQLDGDYTIPSSLQAGASYTLRQLVGYYDNYYNSTQDWTIDLAATTYTLSNINDNFAGSKWAGRNENQNQVGDLDLFPTSYTGIGRLIFAGPSGSYATITCSDVSLSSGGSIPLDRIFQVMSGASLGLQNVKVEGGMALDDSTAEGTDALGGGILVESGGSLSLVGSKVAGNFAIGSAGPNVVGATGSGRKGAGYNASGGGIYGAAGSNLSIDAASIISGNYAQGGHGGNVSGGGLTQGGQGGSAYGGGIAVAAPSSTSSQTTSSVATQLSIAGGATISNNGLNEATSSGNVFNVGGTGGSCAGGQGGNGGNAYGAGLYMGTGQLNLNGGSNFAPLVFSNNNAYSGPGFSTGTSGSNAGANGIANGAGATITPGLVVVTNSPTSGGILEFSNNLVNGAGGMGFFLPTVTTALDTGSTSANDAWNLRTAVAAVNPLVASGMAIALNLPAANLALVSSSSGTNTGSLAVTNSGSGSLTIAGAGASTTVINASALGASAFALSGANVTLKNLQITGAKATGNGGAISALNSNVAATNASFRSNAASTTSGEGGGIYLSGGSLSLNKVTLTNNRAASGGGVFAAGAQVTLSGAAFSQNQATSGGGGAVDVSGGSLLVQNSSAFQSNSAGANGGAILIGGNATSTINGGSVLSNSAGQSGGGIAATGASVALNTVNVSGNVGSASSGYGGGLYQSGGTVHLKNTSVQNNRALQGGGIADLGGRLGVFGGKISGNAAQGSGSGGGLIALNNPAVTLATLSIASNAASGGFGGGIYQGGGNLTIKNGSKLQQNSASQGGGAYLSGTSATVNGGAVKNNTAVVNGGGVLSWAGNFTATGVAISSNRVANGSTIAGYGGGLYQNNGGTLKLAGGTKVVNNSAQYGGGVFVSSSGFAANGSTIAKNTAVSVGGGAAVYSPAQAVNLTNANISSNTIAATGLSNGGGLYLQGGTLNAQGINVKNNRVQAANNQTMEGGGLYAYGAAVNLVGGSSVTSTFSGNTLTGNGSGTAYGAGLFLTTGASLSAQSNITVTGNTITSTASGVGGGIAFFVNTSYSGGYAPTASNNSASAGGYDYAFVVTDTSDNNNTTNLTGPTSVNTFTGGTGSLRSALSYAQNWMNGNANNHSTAIILTPGATYGLSSSYGQLSYNAPGGTTLTLIGENDTSTSQATINAYGSSGSRVFYLNGSGSAVLQNLVVTGGRVASNTIGSSPEGGGIFLDGASLTLNNAAVTGNTAIATAAGTPGTTGTYKGGQGGAGGSGTAAYGGGIFLNQGVLNLLSNASVTGNTVQGSNGGNGGPGGGGGEHTATTSDCDYTDGGNGGSGGAGGDAKGGGIYQAGGTLNAPSTSNVYGNTETPGQGGAGGAGGSSGSHDGCSWHSGSTGSNGASGGGSGTDYYYAGGQECLSQSSVQGALSIGASAAPRLSIPRGLSGVILQLYSVDGRLIDTTRSADDGSFRFAVPYTGAGYVQVARMSTYTVAPLHTRVSPGVVSSFDPRTLRTAVMQFLDGVAVNQPIVLLMRPVKTEFQTGPNSVQLINADTGAVIWRAQLKPQGYRGGFTSSAVDLDGDETSDYVVLPRYGSATPWLIDGRTGHVTFVSGTVSANLARGFSAVVKDLLGERLPQVVLVPSNDRSGRISVIDLNTRSVLWNAKSNTLVAGGMTVTFATSYPSNVDFPRQVILSSKTLDVGRDGHNWQKWLDGRTGQLTLILDPKPYLGVNRRLLKQTMSYPNGADAWRPAATGSKHPGAPGHPAGPSRHVHVSRAMILRRHLKPI